MDLNGVMLSEVSQRKTNSVRSHSHVESEKKKKLIERENRLVLFPLLT